MNKTITIITPTYNRGFYLIKLYESLCKQTNKNFSWLIIDDGSTDNTREIVDKFNNNIFPISYRYKHNGGKHKALNFAFELINTEYFFIVDSDDYIPTNSIETIMHYLSEIDLDENIIGIGGLRADQDSFSMIGTTFSGGFIDCFPNFRSKYGITGDKAEVFKTFYFKQNHFPEYENERFLSESVLWNTLYDDGLKIRWINEIIYYGKYMSDGLTVNIDDNYKNSPLGFRDYLSSLMKYENINFFKKIYLLGYYKDITKCPYMIVKEFFNVGTFQIISGLILRKLKVIQKKYKLLIRKSKTLLYVSYDFLTSNKPCQKATLLSAKESIEIILKKHLSVIRLGDGEFNILKNKSICYQDNSEQLSVELKSIVDNYSKRRNDLLICMPNDILKKNNFKIIRNFNYFLYWSTSRKMFKKHFDFGVIYGDAFLFDEEKVNLYSQIWASGLRKVIFVHRDEIYARNFENVYKIPTLFIKCPSKNAYDFIDILEKKVINCVENKEDTLVLISCGPAAKCLVSRLVTSGIWCIDTGHCWDEPLKKII